MPEAPQDKNMQNELEDLYRKVAIGDHPRSNMDKDIDLSSCYAVLQVSPDATLVEITDAYNRLKDTWREDRFVNIDPWQEKSKEKLAEIKEAYENILAYRQYESRDRLVHETEINLGHSRLPEQEDLFSEEPPAKLEPDAATARKKQRWPLIVASLSAGLFFLFGLFVWPTLYRYDVIKAGNKVYPLRINRVTSAIAYFDGKGWAPPPVPVDPPLKPLDTAQSAASPRVSSADPIAQRPPVDMLPKASKPEEKAVAVVAPKAKAPEERFPVRKSAPAAPTEGPKQKAQAARKTENTVKIGAYSIQIKAFREESTARAYMQTLKAEQSKMRIQKTVSHDNKTWYRVLLGSFKSKEEAAAYLKKRKVLQTYPGSFVQSTGKST